MITGIADTHAIIWYLSQDSRLSQTARNFIDETNRDGNQIGISSISFIEMVYLIEKGRIPAESFSNLIRFIDTDRSVFVEVPVDLSIARILSRVSSVAIPDMPDRIVAATSLFYNVPVISRDGKIQLSGLTTIW